MRHIHWLRQKLENGLVCCAGLLGCGFLYCLLRFAEFCDWLNDRPIRR